MKLLETRMRSLSELLGGFLLLNKKTNNTNKKTTAHTLLVLCVSSGRHLKRLHTKRKMIEFHSELYVLWLYIIKANEIKFPMAHFKLFFPLVFYFDFHFCFVLFYFYSARMLLMLMDVTRKIGD